MKIELTLPKYRDIVQRVALNENNDCSVLALSWATSVNYQTAHKALNTMGRRPGEGATVKQVIDAAWLMGWQYSNLQSRKMKTVAGVLAKRLDRALVIIRGHIFAIVDGVPFDSNPLDTTRHVVGVLTLYRKAPASLQPDCHPTERSSTERQKSRRAVNCS